MIDIDERQISQYRNAKVLPTEVEYVHRDQVIEEPVYVDNIIEREVYIPIDKIVEVPVERIVERQVE